MRMRARVPIHPSNDRAGQEGSEDRFQTQMPGQCHECHQYQHRESDPDLGGGVLNAHQDRPESHRTTRSQQQDRPDAHQRGEDDQQNELLADPAVARRHCAGISTARAA